jgi:tetratricopeptide (TPR) repeat protein
MAQPRSRPWLHELTWDNRGSTCLSTWASSCRAGCIGATPQTISSEAQLMLFSKQPVSCERDLELRFVFKKAVSCARRGVTLEALGRFEEAIVDYRAVLKAAPNDPAGWNNLGNASAGLGRWGRRTAEYRTRATSYLVHRMGHSGIVRQPRIEPHSSGVSAGVSLRLAACCPAKIRLPTSPMTQGGVHHVLGILF